MHIKSVYLTALSCFIGTLLQHCGSSLHTLSVMSVGQIGCPSKDMAISNVDIASGGYQSWQVVCHGKTFLCSSYPGDDSATQVECKREEPGKSSATDPNKTAS